jgi:hypothetical protein
MDHLAVCGSNLLKLCRQTSPNHNIQSWFFCVELIILFVLDVNKLCDLFTFWKTLKDHKYGYQMKGAGLGSKNMFIFLFLCLFTFCKHKQRFDYIWKNRCQTVIGVTVVKGPRGPMGAREGSPGGPKDPQERKQLRKGLWKQWKVRFVS